MTHERRVVLSLAIAQALFQTSAVLLVTVGGLAGQMLAPDTALATLPIACVALGTAVATLPASLLMGRVGRRPGFVLGALLGASGGGLAAFAMLTESFPLLCVATGLVGGYQGFAQFYRFAAAEAASEAFRSRAISLVLAGGVVAALVGPHLGAVTKDLIGPAAYAGSFLAVLALSLVAAVVVAATPLPSATAGGEAAEPPRPLPMIMRQPKFIAALVGAAVGYAVMVLVMTATPLSMVGHHHGVADAAFVIQWHVLGMFVPSFFTGWLVKRFGLTVMMLTGVLLLLTHVAVAMSGIALLNYLSGLVLLGVGWNFLYVGGSTLLTETYRPSERSRVQGLNDFLIVGVAAAASFSAGALVEAFGWRGLNLAAVPFLMIAGAALVFG
ncbi:MFS transporter, partial [Phenylobacterium sp.]|uniref:MFS transporter n=1 Tax=Phenylobacterium sp. TaxID=1871053 RepID=UPI002E3386B6